MRPVAIGRPTWSLLMFYRFINYPWTLKERTTQCLKTEYSQSLEAKLMAVRSLP
jgi:hypothetical protein